MVNSGLKCVIAVPTYNEVDNLPLLLERLSQVARNFTILIVDDNSPDGTGAAAEKLKTKYNFLEIIHNQDKTGLGAAYQSGFKWALEHGADIIGEMDADLSHQPKELPRLINAVSDGADIIIGSRRIPGGKIIGWSAWRQFTSWAAMTTARLILGLKTKDVTSGFRLYTRTALNKIPWPKVQSSGYAWQEELIFLAERAKLKIVEIPITFIDRQHGQSKLSFKDVQEFFLTIFKLWRQ